MTLSEVRRGHFYGMHAMRGSRQGVTLKRVFEDEASAVAEAGKLSAPAPPEQRLSAYLCLFGDAPGTWGQGVPHWHVGRDRARWAS